MSQPQQPTDPQPASDVEAEASETSEGAEAAEDAAPLNRADRRARAKQDDPSHVGPRAGTARTTRGPRSHTKRRSS